jgi:hypothetical protein
MPDDLEPDPPRDRCTLPTRLLHALLAGTTPDHPLVGIAVDRVLRTESLASYTAETALATELLGRVYAAGHAPLALLHAALAADDNSLVRLALTSPDLPEVDRNRWLTAAEPKRLAAVALHLEGAPTAGLVAAEVARRTPAGRRMIDVLDGEPGVAEQLLLAGPVAVEVLDTAIGWCRSHHRTRSCAPHSIPASGDGALGTMTLASAVAATRIRTGRSWLGTPSTTSSPGSSKSSSHTTPTSATRPGPTASGSRGCCSPTCHGYSMTNCSTSSPLASWMSSSVVSPPPATTTLRVARTLPGGP